MNVSQKISPGNVTYASATKHGKKVSVIGDSHLRRSNRNIFKEPLAYCGGNLKYFSGAKTLDLEHYMKLALNNNRPDAVIIQIGWNDLDFRNSISETAVKDIAEHIIKVDL